MNFDLTWDYQCRVSVFVKCLQCLRLSTAARSFVKLYVHTSYARVELLKGLETRQNVTPQDESGFADSFHGGSAGVSVGPPPTVDKSLFGDL